MPPRKRAASAPKAEPEQEPLAPETEADGQQADPGDEAAPAPTDPADEDASPVPADGGAQDPDEDAPERSDLQTADKPCGECFPNGWPEGAFSVGCTHGTYVRSQD